MTRVCASPVCDLPVRARGWCRAHYERWYRHGDALPDVPVGGVSTSSWTLHLRLPALPLVQAVERRGGLRGVLSDYGSPESSRLRRAYYRAKQRGYVYEGGADDLAIHLLGVHPGDLWEEYAA